MKKYENPILKICDYVNDCNIASETSLSGGFGSVEDDFQD